MTAVGLGLGLGFCYLINVRHIKLIIFIFHSTDQICAIANAKTRRKVSTRFGVAMD